MYLRPWISKHTWVKFNRSQLVQVEAQELKIPNQWGITHIKKGTHQLPHFWPLIFTPYISQKPLFLPKRLSPKVLFFPHCPKFWKVFTQRPQIGWNLRKRYPKSPYFYSFCHWKTPYFLPYMHMFEGNVPPSNTVRWEILYSWNRIVQVGEYF